MDDLMMKAMGLPQGFGQTTRKVAPLKQPVRVADGTLPPPEALNSGSRIPPAAQPNEPAKPTNKDSDSESDTESDNYSPDALPLYIADLVSHQKPVCAMSLDPSQSRLVTGSRDYVCTLWDFHGMSSLRAPFWSWEPASGNPIRSIQFNSTGGMILVAPTTSQARLFSRDGDDLGIFCKGDPYLRDLRVTKGHTSNLTSCMWHPNDTSFFMTSGNDSTVRIWDVEVRDSQKHVIAISSKTRGGRTAIGSAMWSSDARLIACGGKDGIIRIYNTKSSLSIPSIQIAKAHVPDNDIQSLSFSFDGMKLLSRSMDSTMALWDIRNSKVPVNRVKIDTFYEESNCIMSPNERYILAGSSTAHSGALQIYTPELEFVRDIPMKSACIHTMWSAKLNQVFVGCGDGSIQCLYDPQRSHNGILVPLAKAPKRIAVDDYEIIMDQIMEVPPSDTEEVPEDYKVAKERRQKITAAREKTRPDNPTLVAGQGKNGKLGNNLTAHIMKGLIKSTIRNQDPREEILKHAKEAAENPYWVAPAYKNGHVLAKDVYENDLERKREESKRRRK